MALTEQPQKARPKNKSAEKLRTPHERQAEYEAYIEHLELGYSKHTYCGRVCAKTVESTVARYPEEFPDGKDRLEQALRISLFKLEQIGMAGMMGRVKDFNSATWIFTMKNRASWRDRREVAIDKEIDGTDDAILNKISIEFMDAAEEADILYSEQDAEQ